MTRRYLEAPATHYRLSDETWALIAEEYRNGATAKDLGAKWKVAPSSVYRHACKDGWTKKSMGDARARAHARMVEEEEGAHRGLHATGSRALKGLFSPAPGDDGDAGDPAALGRLATLASGRAMTGRLWTEARALAGLAESYARLAEKQDAAGGGGLTIETMDLKLLLEIVVDNHWKVTKRFERRFDGREDPEDEVKQAYWAFHDDMHRAVTKILQRLMMRAGWAEKRLSAAGLEPDVQPVDAEIEAWARGYLSAPMSEANVCERAQAAAQIWRDERAREKERAEARAREWAGR